MPKTSTPHDGFQPIEVEVGEQNPPIVSEVDFSTPASEPAQHKPQPAARNKED